MVYSFHLLGSPPHVRGPHYPDVSRDRPKGITPACAGTTSLMFVGRTYQRDHPRMCGDHLIHNSSNTFPQGSPPHVRGPLRPVALGPFSHGITPACAGTTFLMTKNLETPWDHPRMCGDHWERDMSLVTREGSPPHVRGPPPALFMSFLGLGITPACAGTT